MDRPTGRPPDLPDLQPLLQSELKLPAERPGGLTPSYILTIAAFHINPNYYTGLLNAMERSVHLHGPFTTSGGELYLIIHRC